MVPYFRSLRHFTRYRNYVLHALFRFEEGAERDDVDRRIAYYRARLYCWPRV